MCNCSVSVTELKRHVLIAFWIELLEPVLALECVLDSSALVKLKPTSTGMMQKLGK